MESPAERISNDAQSIRQANEKAMRDEIQNFGIDFEDVRKNYEINPQFSKDAKDKMLQVESVAENFEMLLMGKSLVKSGDNEVYRQTGKALASSGFIKLVGGMLRSFAQGSNLIGNKREDDFFMQFIDGFNKVASTIMRDRSISEKHHRIILKLYKDRMWNIGDIIMNSKGNMQAMFSGRQELDEFAALDRYRRGGIGDSRVGVQR